MIFGWDISTSVVGFSELDNDGKWVRSSYFDFSKMAKGAESLHDKMDECEWWIDDLLGRRITGSHMHFFEDRLGNFSFGKTQLQTLMKLAAFNSLFSYVVWKRHMKVLEEADDEGEFGVGTAHIHPSTVKATMKHDGLIIMKGCDKKQLTLDFVKNKIAGFPIELNRNGKPKPFCYDMADSYIVARAGFLRRYLSHDAKGKKASGDPKDAGERTCHQG